eukprot:scaffold182722_cov17-Tisochrysis_lutea.AAC.1
MKKPPGFDVDEVACTLLPILTSGSRGCTPLPANADSRGPLLSPLARQLETAGDCYIVTAGILSNEERNGFVSTLESHDPTASARRVMEFAKALLGETAKVRDACMPGPYTPHFACSPHLPAPCLAPAQTNVLGVFRAECVIVTVAGKPLATLECTAAFFANMLQRSTIYLVLGAG